MNEFMSAAAAAAGEYCSSVIVSVCVCVCGGGGVKGSFTQITK